MNKAQAKSLAADMVASNPDIRIFDIKAAPRVFGPGNFYVIRAFHWRTPEYTFTVRHEPDWVGRLAVGAYDWRQKSLLGPEAVRPQYRDEIHRVAAVFLRLWKANIEAEGKPYAAAVAAKLAHVSEVYGKLVGGGN